MYLGMRLTGVYGCPICGIGLTAQEAESHYSQVKRECFLFRKHVFFYFYHNNDNNNNGQFIFSIIYNMCTWIISKILNNIKHNCLVILKFQIFW